MKTACYIHVPFCPTGCKFCHFYLEGTKKRGYVSLLRKEFYLRFGNSKIQTDCIHIGGGTPNILSGDELEELLKFVLESYENYTEFSIELHPALCSKAQLDLLKKYGVNRLSFGIQSLDHDILANHTRVDINYDKLGDLVIYAKQLGFHKINFDFIYDLIGDSFSNIKRNISFIRKYKPTSVYYYRLRRFTDHLKENHTVNEKRALSYYLLIKDFFQEIGYTRLNNSVYFSESQLGSQKPFLYDEIIYATHHRLLGLGVAATSETESGEFSKNSLSFDVYKHQILDSVSPVSLNFTLNDTPQLINRFYFYILQYHTFYIGDFYNIFGYDGSIETVITRLIQNKMARFDNDIFSLTEKGHYYIDEKLADILFLDYPQELELLKKL